MKKNGMEITNKELAGRLGVSPGTVSFVLGGRGDEMRISRKTQWDIFRMARQYGYEPVRGTEWMLEKEYRSGLKRILVFNVDMEGTRLRFSRFLYGVQKKIIKEALQVQLILQPFADGKLHLYERLFDRTYCEGVIIYGGNDEDISWLMEKEFGVPVVLFNRATEKYSSVYVDDYEIGSRAAETFYKRGHRDVGIVMANQGRKAGSLRMAGFFDRCKGLGLQINNSHIQKGELDPAGGMEAAKKMLAGDRQMLPTAIFVQVGDMVVGVLKAFAGVGIRIPEDVEIVTCGDSGIEGMLSTSLSVVKIPVEEMAGESLDILLGQMEIGDSKAILKMISTSIAVEDGETSTYMLRN